LTLDDFRGLEKTDERPSRIQCPRCTVNLTESQYGPIWVDECFGCGGTWFDNGEMQEFVRRFRARKEEAEGPPLAEKLKPFTHDGKVQYVPCPRCRRMMARSNFGRISGVIVDQCPAHGMWLDGGEIEKIVTFLRSGGLEKGEQRRVEELREQAQRLEGRAASARGTLRGLRWLGPVSFWKVW